MQHARSVSIGKQMKIQSTLFTLGLFVIGAHSSFGQTVEVKLDEAQPKITTVSAMRARRSPVVSGEEIMRLKLGTVVSATARSSDQDTVAGKTDYWYRVNLPNGESGWVFGGLLLDYNSRTREELVTQIIEDRLKAEKTEFADRQEIYNLAATSVTDAKDANTRAEFDLLAALVDAQGEPLSRAYLIEVISNRQADVDLRTVDALVARLRRKLVSASGRPVIATVTGVGYRIALDNGN